MSDTSKKKKPSFRDFVHAKDGGIDPADGLAGWGYDGPYKYPDAPEKGYAFTEPAPYANPDEPDDKTGYVWVARDNDGEPLGDEMSPGMDKATALGKKPDLKKAVQVHKWKKLTNEQFLAVSQASSPAKMMDMAEEGEEALQPITDLFGNSFTPEPNQTINYLIGILAKSPRMMDRFVIEAKNRGAFEKILESMMQHQSCFDGMVEMFGHPKYGKSHSHQLAHALHDRYSKALDAVDLGESAQPGVEKRFGPAAETAAGDITTKGVFGDSASKSIYGSDNGNNEFGEKPGTGVFGSNGGQNPASMGKGMGAQGGAGMPDATSPGPDFGPQSAPPPGSPMAKKMKAESAAGNLFEASARHPHLKGLMMDMCKDGNC